MSYVNTLIFDLDDTLYPELTYVYSGFKHVAQWLSTHSKTSPDDLFHRMVDLLEKEGRGHIFDTILLELGLYSQKMVRCCLNHYRNHPLK